MGTVLRPDIRLLMLVIRAGGSTRAEGSSINIYQSPQYVVRPF